MKRRLLKIGVLGMLAAGTVAGSVQAADGPVYSFDEVVVTATRTLKEIQEVPSSVSVVTAQDIEQKNIRSVREAIGQIPGMYMDMAGENQDSGAIQLRGFGTSDILVLVDGVQMNSTYNSAASLNDIAVNNIERIEVLRGAASSIYGGHAVGGVISVTTKEAKEQGTHADFNISYGSHNTWKKSIYVDSKVNEKWSFGVGWEDRKSDGFRGFYRSAKADKKLTKAGKADYTATLPQLSDGYYVYGGRGEKAWDHETFSVYAKYNLSDSKSLKYTFARNQFEYSYRNPFSYVYDADGNMVFSGTVKTQNGDIFKLAPSRFYGYEGSSQKDRHIFAYNDTDNKLKATFSYSEDAYNGFTSPDVPGKYTKMDWDKDGDYSTHPEKIYNLSLEKAWEKIGGKHTIVAGMDIKQEEVNQDRYVLSRWKDRDSKTHYYSHSDGKVKNFALYVQDEWQLSKPLTMYIGARYDHFEKGRGYFWDDGYWGDPAYNYTSDGKNYNEISPKIAFDFKANDTTNYYISYGHSFNPPQLYQVYRYGGGGMGAVIPNPGLNPEKSDTFEIGMKKKLGEGTEFSVNLYHVKTKDKVAYTYFYDPATGDLTHKQYINYSEEKRRGVEVELKKKFNDSLSGYVNWAWQYGVMNGPAIPNTNKDEAYDDVRDYYIPKHIFHAGLDYRKDRLNVLLECEYVSARMSPEYESGEYGAEDSFFLVNTAINYDLAKDCTLQFAVNNLLDRHYYCSEATDGRNYTIGLRYRM